MAEVYFTYQLVCILVAQASTQQSFGEPFMQTEPKHALVPALGEALYVRCPPLERMSQTKPAAFLPHWLKIDHRHGKWLGEFGY